MSEKRRPSEKSLANLKPPWTSEEASEMGKKGRESAINKTVRAREILADLGYKKESEAPAYIRTLAEEGARGKTDALRLILGQTGQLVKPNTPKDDGDWKCPECGFVSGAGPKTMELGEGAVASIESARNRALARALAKLDPNHKLLKGKLA